MPDIRYHPNPANPSKSRISDLFDTLDDVSSGICGLHIFVGNYRKSTIDVNKDLQNQHTEKRQAFDLTQRGVIHEQDDVIEFKDAPIVTPNGDILVRAVA